MPLDRLLTNALLLFDGVNELPSEEARTELIAFRHTHPNLPMIFTTRDLSLGGDLGIECKLEMQPLTEPQMQAFVRAYLPKEQAEPMLRKLKERLRELGQTPLLLWMLCGLFQQTGTIPENLGLVFRLFTQGYERQLKQDVRVESDRTWWQPVLQQLAWGMMQGEKPTELRVAIGRKAAVGAIAQFLNGKVPYAEDFAHKCLRDLQKYHLIQAGTNPEELEFRHQLIQEYYAAEALLERLPGLSDAALQQEYLNYLKWTEPVALMLALCEDAALAVRGVQQALQVDLLLGARLAGEVKSSFQLLTLAQITRLDVKIRLHVALLERTGSEQAIPGLLKAIEHSDWWDVCRSAAAALGKIGSEQAIPALLQAIEDSDSDVRRSAAAALGTIGSEQAIPALLKAIEHSDWEVRRIAAAALGTIGSEQAIPALLQAIEHSASVVRRSAAAALGKIGSEQAIAGLLQAIEHSDWDVRRIAAAALGTIGSEQAIAGLLQAIEHSHWDVRWSAAAALGTIGSEQAIPALLQAIEDSDSEVRRSAAAALGEIDSEQAIPGLLKAIKDSDSEVRRSAAAALGEIDSEQAIPGLLKAIKDSDSEVRRSAAEALGKIGSEQALPGLLQAIADSDRSVRSSTAAALGKIGSEQAIPALLQAFEDSDEYVRRSAAEALGKIGSEQALPGLLQAIADSDRYVRINAAEALGKIGSEQAIAGLLQAIEHSASEVRRSAAEAILQIGNPHSLTLLQSQLRSAPYPNILSAIQGIQANCKFYNYELFAAHLAAQKADRPQSQSSDRPSTINQFPNVTEVKIFETVDRYYEASPKDPPS